MKTIDTLVQDIYQVVDNGGGWDETVTKFMASELESVLNKRFGVTEGEARPAGLRLSQLGTPCKRKLWYSINKPNEGESLPPSTKLKFLYGDILEQLLISLAMSAGHRVEGLQDQLEIAGIKGHRDCVIDGVTVDIKSASSFAFKKFASGGLRDDDPFGYISQLSSYVYAGRDSEVDSHPTLGAFLVIDKQNGTLCLDMYNFGPEIKRKEQEVEDLKVMVAQPTPPPRGFDPVPEGTSGNMRLGVNCSYCDRKKECWENLRGFAYSNGPKFLTEVVKLPKVPEFQV